MIELDDKVLAKMNLQRLRSHRTSVLAHIHSQFCETCTECDPVHVYVIDIESQNYKDAIEYRDKVNQYYFAARNKTEVK